MGGALGWFIYLELGEIGSHILCGGNGVWFLFFPSLFCIASGSSSVVDMKEDTPIKKLSRMQTDGIIVRNHLEEPWRRAMPT